MGLYISVTTASSGLAKSPIDMAITRLAGEVAMKTRQGLVPAGPSLDVTFMLPGKEEKPGFAGLRMGGYTPADDTLFFEQAVPEPILNSSRAPDYVALVMQDVLSNAAEFFAENDLAFDLVPWQVLMAQLDATAGAAP